MRDIQILVVAPVGWNVELLSKWDPYHFAFQFVESFPSDGFSAWRTSTSVSGEQLDVATTCSAFGGGYAQHALNRLFTQALLRLNPKIVVIVGLAGCTVDLVRVADLLGIPVLLILDAPREPLDSLSEATLVWLKSSITACKSIVSHEKGVDSLWPKEWFAGELQNVADLATIVGELLAQTSSPSRYDYSHYEFSQRDHPLLVRMQRGSTQHFEGCKNVVDIACGVGIFLDCLRLAGINAKGIERDVRIARYAQEMGLDVTAADALEFLDQTRDSFDGVFCSHFVEHLPFEAVQRMLQLIARRTIKGGILVLVFPDPESIRSQLLGFWRDPEHVRFYHPELITLIAATVGFELEWSSYIEQPHSVPPFADQPSPLQRVGAPPILTAAEGASAQSFGEKVLQRLGLVTHKRFRRLEDRLSEWSSEMTLYSRQRAVFDEQLEDRTNVLWSVNQTWSWNDNVTLRLRKRFDL
jgi:2-polyprenyl-3-methyl-5-hydroxy-6-metoxy-1,4-benzoquinol methylase